MLDQTDKPRNCKGWRQSVRKNFMVKKKIEDECSLLLSVKKKAQEKQLSNL